MSDQFDAIVVGLGPGGERVATVLAEAGWSVLGVEQRLLGGECPYFGCVPSKMMVRAANALAEARRVPKLGGTVRVEADWAPVASRIRDEATDDWNDQIAIDRFTGKGGRFLRGRATLSRPRSVTVDGEEFSAVRALVLATGTAPSVPGIDGLEQTPFWTNRDVVRAEAVPATMTIIGGGAIGMEFAQVFARFGTRVEVVESSARLLPNEEPEAGDLVAQVLAGEGVRAHLDAHVQRVDHDGQAFTVRVAGGPDIVSDRLLVATGRSADLAGLGVSILGIDEKAASIAVDADLRVTDGVWAVGDVTGHGAYTHVALYQANVALADILDRPHRPADYRAVPRVTFTDPEVGSVGLTESQARDRGLAVRTGLAALPSSSRGWIHHVGNDGFLKLVEDTGRGVLVGATSVGPSGGEVLAALTVAVHAKLPTAELERMIYAYPTFHRAIEDALTDLRSA